MYLQAVFAVAVLLTERTLGASGSILLSEGTARCPEMIAARVAAHPAGQLTVRVEEVSTTSREKRGGSTAPLQKMDTSGAWDQNTAAACTKGLNALNGHTSNPSGMAVCYNLPFYDGTTGVFQADLRLYHLSDPRDGWAGVQGQDINVGLSYIGAAVSAGATKRMAPPEVAIIARPPAKRDSGSRRQDTLGPQMLQVFNFVGQINKGLMASNLTEYVNLLEQASIA